MSEPMTERYLDNFLANALSACVGGKRSNVWADAYAEDVPELVAEVRRLQQENDRLCVLIAYVDDASPLKQVKRLMNENEAGQLWEAARRRGRALVEKAGEDDNK